MTGERAWISAHQPSRTQKVDGDTLRSRFGDDRLGLYDRDETPKVRRERSLSDDSSGYPRSRRFDYEY